MLPSCWPQCLCLQQYDSGELIPPMRLLGSQNVLDNDMMGCVLFYSCNIFHLPSCPQSRHSRRQGGRSINKKGGRLFFQKTIEDRLLFETRQKRNSQLQLSLTRGDFPISSDIERRSGGTERATDRTAKEIGRRLHVSRPRSGRPLALFNRAPGVSEISSDSMTRRHPIHDGYCPTSHVLHPPSFQRAPLPEVVEPVRNCCMLSYTLIYMLYLP